MHGPTPQLPELADALWRWYWTFGARRRGKRVLPYTWVDHTFRLRSSAEWPTLKRRLTSRNSTIAFWGPSQSGKSMYLSRYLDHLYNGHNAITWDFKHPIRYIPEDGTTVTALNPWNAGGEATACPTLFYCPKEPESVSTTTPVTVRLSSRRQLLHAFAAGFLLEGTSRTTLTFDRVDTLCTRILGSRSNNDTQLPSASMIEPSPVALEIILDTLATIESLATQNFPSARYVTQERDRWAQLKRTAIAAGTHVSADTALQFASAMLWDDCEPITATMHRLFQYRDTLLNLEPSGVLCVNLELTAWLLDASTYPMLIDGTRDGLQRFRLNKSEQHVCIAEEGELLFSNADDFGSFQALVSEIYIPLRIEPIADIDPTVASLLQVADIVDIPGLPNQGESGHTGRIDFSSSDIPEHLIISRLLKRGRAFSAINTFVQSGGVDALVLFVRPDRPIALPGALTAGIKSILGYQLDLSSIDTADTTDIAASPTILCFSLISHLIDNIAGGASKRGDLRNVVDQMKPVLDAIGRPPAAVLALTYPHVPDGKFHTALPARETAIQSMVSDRALGRHLKSEVTRRSLAACIEREDGGASILAETLLGTVNNKTLERNTQTLLQRLDALATYAAPLAEDDAPKQWRALMENLEAHTDNIIRQASGSHDPISPLQKLARTMRDAVSVAPHHLPPVPERAADNGRALPPYLDDALSGWITQPEDNARLETLGLTAEQGLFFRTQVVRLLDRRDILHWIRTTLGHVRTLRDAMGARALLAAELNRRLIGKGMWASELGPPINGHDDLNSFFVAAMDPFCEIDEILPLRVTIRPLLRWISTIPANIKDHSSDAQPGDEEILAIRRAVLSRRNGEDVKC